MQPTPFVVRAAELHRQDLVAKVQREQRIDDLLRTARVARRPDLTPARVSPLPVATLTVRSARYLLTSLARVAFGLHLN